MGGMTARLASRYLRHQFSLRLASDSKAHFQAILKSGPKAVYQAIKRRDDADAAKAYRSFTEAIRPLGSILEGVRFTRTDEQRKLKNILDKLRRIRNLSDPEWVEKVITEYGVSTAYDSVEDLEKEAKDTLKYWDRLEGYLTIDTKYKRGPFTIVNSHGFTPEESEPVLKVFDKAVSLIHAAGFNSILYGDVLLVSAMDFAGSYRPATDSVRLNVEAEYRFSSLDTIIHELGHRHWYQVLSQDQRDRYTDLYAGTSEDPPYSMPEREHFWAVLESSQFQLRSAHKKLKPAELERFKAYYKDRASALFMKLKYPLSEQEAAYLPALKKHFLRPSQRWVLLDHMSKPKSVTDYGSSDVKEDYAEVFAFYVQKKPLSPDAELRFKIALE